MTVGRWCMFVGLLGCGSRVLEAGSVDAACAPVAEDAGASAATAGQGLPPFAWDAGINVACVGDSITYGYPTTTGGYPTVVNDLLGPGNTVVNVGVDGETLATMDQSTQLTVLHNLFLKTASANIATICGGINDVWHDDAGEPETFALLVDWCTKARSSGFTPIVIDIPPPAGVVPPAWIAQYRLDMASLVDAGLAAAYVPLDDAGIGEMHSPDDMVHPSQAGYDRIGYLVAQTVAAVAQR